MEVSGKRLEFIGEVNTEEIEILCEVCEADHVSTKANGTCSECEEYMCSSCLRQHLKAKSCRHHILIDISRSFTLGKSTVENVEKCKRHINETIKFYCRKHEIVGCGECMIPGHSACQPENMKDLSKGFHQTKDFQSLMGKLEELMVAVNQNIKHIHENKKTNKLMLKEALKEIDHFRTEINSYLDKAEASISRKANSIKDENDTRLAKLEQDCKTLPLKIAEVTQTLDTSIYEDSALFIQSVKCKPDILDIERKLSQAQVQIEKELKIFCFIPDKRLNNYIQIMQTFGDIAVSVATVGENMETRDQSHDRRSGSTDIISEKCEKKAKDSEGSLDRNHLSDGRDVDEKGKSKFLDMQGGKKADRTFHIQIETVLSDVDSCKKKFMNHSRECQLSLERQLDACNTKVDWNEESKHTLLKCRVTTVEKDGFKLVDRYLKIAEGTFRNFMQKMIVKYVLAIPTCYSEVLEQLRNVTIDNPNATAVLIDRFKRVITVVGINPDTKTLSEKISEIIKQVIVAGGWRKSNKTE